MPPSGPSPGYRSGRTGRSSAASSIGSPPYRTTVSHPASDSASATRDAIGVPPNLDEGLRATHAAAGPTSEYDTDQHRISPDQSDGIPAMTGRVAAGRSGIVRLRRFRRSPWPSRRDRACTAGTRDWWARTTARTRSPATRWHATRPALGDSPHGRPRSGRSCRDRDRRAPPTHRDIAGPMPRRRPLPIAARHRSTPGPRRAGPQRRDPAPATPWWGVPRRG